MKKIPLIYIFLLLIQFSCSNPKSVKELVKEEGMKPRNGFYYFKNDDLVRFGIVVTDSSVMYNNKMFNLGTLNMVIKGENYSIGTASSTQTSFDFYPRYITTIDTVQRYAYNLQGKGSNTVEEAQKWATFDKLIPVVVEQKMKDKVFGETLVFWFTKTDSLLVLLEK